MRKQEEKGAVLSVVDRVIEAHVKPYSESGETAKINIGGCELHFRRMQRFSELKDFEAAGCEFLKSGCNNPHPSWKEHLPANHEDRIAAFTLHYYSAEPTKISMVQAFKFIKNPPLIARLLAFIEIENSCAIYTTEIQEIETAKKD
jgi:hypothetical protein